jgi:hypothetical protein
LHFQKLRNELVVTSNLAISKTQRHELRSEHFFLHHNFFSQRFFRHHQIAAVSLSRKAQSLGA